MKKLLLISALIISGMTSAQAPQGIQYQAVALNGAGNPISNSNVGVRLSVLNDSATGTVLYTETHTRPTNAQGLFNLVVGQGTVVTGNFAGIIWANGSKFLKVEMDAAGGSNYTVLGTTQLLSVPYALHAASTSSVAASALAGVGSESLKGISYIILDNTSVKGFYNGTWASTTFPDTVYSDDVLESNGTFLVMKGSTVKTFYKGIWSTQNFSGEVYSDEVVISGNSFIVIDGNSVKGFSNGNWATQAFSSEVYTDEVFTSNGVILVIDNATARAFYNGAWYSQACSSTIYSDQITYSNGIFLILDGSSIKSFANGAWTTQAFSGTVYSDSIISSPTE